MADPRKTANWPIVATLLAVAVFLVLLAFYTGGYFEMTTKVDEWSPWIDRDVLRVRWFSATWQVTLYKPAARIEEMLTGKAVIVSSKPVFP